MQFCEILSEDFYFYILIKFYILIVGKIEIFKKGYLRNNIKIIETGLAWKIN